MNNLNIKYKEMPNAIIGFYTQLNKIEFIVLNTYYKTSLQALAYLGCMYYKKQGCLVGKILITDIEKDTYAPIAYAKAKIKEYLKE